MGFTTSTLACLGALAAIIIAAPIDEASTPAIFARAEASVFMCDDTRFRGRCRTDVIQTGSCCEFLSKIERLSRCLISRY